MRRSHECEAQGTCLAQCSGLRLSSLHKGANHQDSSWGPCGGVRAGAGGGTDHSQLEHVLKFSFGCLEMGWGQAAGTGEDWRAYGLDMMCDVVLDWCVWVGHLSEGRELSR